MNITRPVLSITSLLLALSIQAQTAPAENPFQSLSFLEGTWEAKTAGSSRVDAGGRYAFVLELKNHIMGRHTIGKGSCKGPENFDCDHGDLLYIYPDGPQKALHAIYFDNEGHVIQYRVSTPAPDTAVFLSDNSQPGPQFRLIYERKVNTMFGKFQMRLPGQSEWKAYLEWSGDKR